MKRHSNTQSNIPPFQHEPLDLSRQEIRLINFVWQRHPITGIKSPAFRFHVTIHDFDAMQPGSDQLMEGAVPLATSERRKPPQYVALSYTWGSIEDNVEIIVDDRRMSISRNLFDFLSAFGEEHKSVYFWADQMCIDQQNIGERNHQVSLMANVYRTATLVVAWLGPLTSSSEQVLRYLERCDAIILRPWRPTHNQLEEFFDREYWTRLWVVQELRLAKGVTMMCGSRQTARSAFKEALDYANLRLSEPLMRKKLMVQDLLGSSYGFGTLRTTPLLTLRRALELYGEKKCADRRDRVFGLEALVRPEQRIAVDYTLTPLQLLRKVLQITLGDCVSSEYHCVIPESSRPMRGCLEDVTASALNAVYNILDVRPGGNAKHFFKMLAWSNHLLNVIRLYPGPRATEIEATHAEERLTEYDMTFAEDLEAFRELFRRGSTFAQKQLAQALLNRAAAFKEDVMLSRTLGKHTSSCENAWITMFRLRRGRLEWEARLNCTELQTAVKLRRSILEEWLEDTMRETGFRFVDGSVVHPDDLPDDWWDHLLEDGHVIPHIEHLAIQTLMF